MNSSSSDFIQRDAERAFAVLADGGIALAPMDIGYSLLGGSREALDTIFTTKGRAATKLNAMVGDDTLANELFDLTPEGQDVLRTITEHYGLPLGAIGRIHTDHPFIEGMDATTRAASTKGQHGRTPHARWPLPRGVKPAEQTARSAADRFIREPF